MTEREELKPCDGWVKKRKGSAHIYRKEGCTHAIVDRRGLGISVLGITYKGESFASVEEAAAFASMEQEG